jgi:hypothetical protein
VKRTVGRYRRSVVKEVDAMLKGGCFCGWIRYETGATPFDETNCHCSICRRTTGAPFVAWFSVPRSQFRLVCGEPTRFRSTTKGTRSFCPRCGTQVTFEHEDFLDEIDVTTCSLDEPERLPPRGHTHTRVASSVGSNWTISYPNIKKIGKKGDVIASSLIKRIASKQVFDRF